MSTVYYTTHNGLITGCASYFFRSEDVAKVKATEQNNKAEQLDIQTRYVVRDVAEHKVDSKLIRPLKEENAK